MRLTPVTNRGLITKKTCVVVFTTASDLTANQELLPESTSNQDSDSEPMDLCPIEWAMLFSATDRMIDAEINLQEAMASLEVCLELAMIAEDSSVAGTSALLPLPAYATEESEQSEFDEFFDVPTYDEP